MQETAGTETPVFTDWHWLERVVALERWHQGFATLNTLLLTMAIHPLRKLRLSAGVRRLWDINTLRRQRRWTVLTLRLWSGRLVTGTLSCTRYCRYRDCSLHWLTVTGARCCSWAMTPRLCEIAILNTLSCDRLQCILSSLFCHVCHVRDGRWQFYHFHERIIVVSIETKSACIRTEFNWNWM